MWSQTTHHVKSINIFLGGDKDLTAKTLVLSPFDKN